MEAAREPYRQPPPPTQAVDDRPRLVPDSGRRPGGGGVARLQRGLLGTGAFATVASAFAVAPYLTFLTLSLVVLVVRTVSWTTQSARERQHLRGRRRWYDAPLTLMTSPWYLLVAAGGTMLLLTWSALVVVLAGLVVAVVQPLVTTGLLVLGAVLALTLWWGPGAKRLRLPARRVAAAASRKPWLGWTAIGIFVLVTGMLAAAVATGQPSWSPMPGPPWRDGTLLGQLVSWF